METTYDTTSDISISYFQFFPLVLKVAYENSFHLCTCHKVLSKVLPNGLKVLMLVDKLQ